MGLSGLTVAQPVLATFGDSPDFFVFRQASGTDIVVFALVIAIAPGLIAWVVSVVVGLVSDRARGVVHHAALAAFASLGVAQIAVAAGVGAGPAMALGLAVGLGLVFARLRWTGLQSWLRWLAPAPVLFVALFLFVAPVSSLVLGDDVDPADLGPFGSGDPPPVVVMVFDEWPLSSIVRTDGSIDEALAPNVARLAARATWYRDTTTVANITNFAVPPILTGNMPDEDDEANASSQPENLFTLLGGTYDLDVNESITRLCPASLCGDDQGSSSAGARASRLSDLLTEAGDAFTARLRPGDGGDLVTDGFVEPEAAVEVAADDDRTAVADEILAPRPERLDEFLAGMEAGEDPTLHYVHVLAPHTPHRHTPDGLRYPSDSSLRLITPPDGRPGADLRSPAPWPARLDRQRLLLEVGHIDRLVGDVLDRLEETGLDDEALVVMTSDHGLGFEPGASARGLGAGPVERSIEPDLLWVPLFIKAPGQAAGAVSDVEARTIDILPTIAGHLSVDLPWAVDGRDLNASGSIADHGGREFVRVEGPSFIKFELDPPVAVRAELAEVFARGTDAQLVGSGASRWWQVGPRPDLVGVRLADLALDPVSDDRLRLDDPGAYDDIDLSSGEAPLLVSGRIEDGAGPRPGAGPVAVLVGDIVAAVVPTHEDDAGPGRFAAMLAPEYLESSDGAVRVADVVDRDGATALRLIPED
jgi:hypothetical protein